MPPSLLHNLRKFNRILKENDNSNVMDLSKYDFIAPPTLLPVLQYMEINNIAEYIPHPVTRHYLRKVLGKEKCTDTTYPLRKLKSFKYTDYFQAIEKIEVYLGELIDEIINLIPSEVDVQSINLLFYEMMNNIYKHSKCDNAYILCQKYPKVDTIDICIIDDGIGIPQSLKDAGFIFENDAEAICAAINGKSSDKEKENLHGRGLNTSASITSLGFGGEMLISSHNGVCTINKKGLKTWDKNMPYIDGTFVTLRINTHKIKDVHEYTKKRIIKRCD